MTPGMGLLQGGGDSLTSLPHINKGITWRDMKDVEYDSFVVLHRRISFGSSDPSERIRIEAEKLLLQIVVIDSCPDCSMYCLNEKSFLISTWKNRVLKSSSR